MEEDDIYAKKYNWQLSNLQKIYRRQFCVLAISVFLFVSLNILVWQEGGVYTTLSSEKDAAKQYLVQQKIEQDKLQKQVAELRSLNRGLVAKVDNLQNKYATQNQSLVVSQQHLIQKDLELNKLQIRYVSSNKQSTKLRSLNRGLVAKVDNLQNKYAKLIVQVRFS